jgi:hypothetical protein
MTHPSPTASLTASDDEGEDGLPDNATAEEAEGEIEFDVMDCVD